jgi:hypothetical protein
LQRPVEMLYGYHTFGGIQWLEVTGFMWPPPVRIVFQCPSHMIAALGPHTRTYQRNAPSAPHRNEIRGHCGVHHGRRCRVPGGRGGHRSDCRHSGHAARGRAQQGNRRALGGYPLGRKPNRDRGMKEAGNLLDRQYFCRSGDATPMFTDAKFERRFRMSRTTYETIRSAVLRTSKADAVYKQAGSVWFHSSPLPALPAPAAALAVPPAIRGNCCRGRRGRRAGSEEGVRCDGREKGWG